MLGRHVIIELHGVNPKLLDDKEFLEKLFIRASKEAGGTILAYHFHKFNPQGVTGIVAIAESHLSIHTWPEFNYAAVDIFTCRGIDPYKASQIIIESLKPEKYFTITLTRGEPYTEKQHA